MFRLNEISLYQFKNYGDASFVFPDRIVALYGPNGCGKTNLMESIYYLCFTKGYFSKQDSHNVQIGKKGFRINGIFEKEGTKKQVSCVIRENGKKEFSIDLNQYRKFSAHIGNFPCVMVSPDDIEMVNGSAEERRRFLDTLISQCSSEYLEWLIDYNKILSQRNSLLRNQESLFTGETDLLDVLDKQLSEKGQKIFLKRSSFLLELGPIIESFYYQISEGQEKIEVAYKSELKKDSMENLLKISRQKDILLQRTCCGIHRDEIAYLHQQRPFRAIASQGQKKSLLFAIKLAEYQIIKQYKKFSPILLLDDVFEKLDNKRMHHLLEIVCCQNQGQVFLSDTHLERLKEAINSVHCIASYIKLD